MNALATVLAAPDELLAEIGVEIGHQVAGEPNRNTSTIPTAWDNRPSWDNWKKYR
ncbi:MAG: hypothetical protein ACRDT6_16385 [Micromonosporaceae bacterium]